MTALSNADPKAFRTLGDGSLLAEGEVNPYYLQDLKRRISVARVGGTLRAFDDLYLGYPLSGGLLVGALLMSQFDGSQFDLDTGAVVRGPASRPLELHEVREQDGEIRLRLA